MTSSKAASHIITNKVPVAFTHQTLRHVEDMLFENEAKYDSIDYIYILDTENKLEGVLSIKDLFRLPKTSHISEVMTKKVVAVHPHTHQEKIVMIALKHNIKAVPVVDKNNQFIGVVPSDEILSATHEELTEDLYKLEGITGKEYHQLSVLKSSPFQLLSVRLPWLLFGLLGGILASSVVEHYQTLLAEEIVLVGFLPLIVYMSDAVGSQTQTIYIRSLAVEEDFSIGRYLIRELAASFLISFVLSVLLGLCIAFLHAPYLGVILGTALFLTVISSVAIAILTPSLLIRLGKDPAVGSGPFATIIRDIMSIVIYFVTASFFIELVR